NLLTPDEQFVFVQKSLQALYLTEFILLVLFRICLRLFGGLGMYLVLLFYLPNRVYYPQVASMDADGLYRTLRNILFYATLEAISFCGLMAVLKRKLHVSAAHQLAFVLETQRTAV
uniref:Uncharacterized protein n=1 Tax=Globisporangium ultimum (strain ATCC 200006 / CBS 805.95 / DAOM BR144) TaxID=431595 RepID=K3WEU4_GLOUD